MKHLLWLILLTACISKQENKSNEFKIIVNVDSAKNGDKLYLTYRDATLDSLLSQTVTFKDGKAVFNGKIDEPVVGVLTRRVIRKVDTAYYKKLFNDAKIPKEQLARALGPVLNPRKNEILEFFLIKGETTIKTADKFDSSKLSGPEGVVEFSVLNKADREYDNKQMEPLYKEQMDLAVAKKPFPDIMSKRDSVLKQKSKDVYGAFIKKNPNSTVAFYAFTKLVANATDSIDQYLEIFSHLPKEMQEWNAAKKLMLTLKGQQNGRIGAIVSDFKQVDTAGRTVSFSSFRGKYVLIELWANWCGPCRKKSPGLVKTFEKYRNKNFTILGVGVETEEAKDRWLKAIQYDKMTWPQVTDFKGWKNAVALQLGVQYIPYNFLVDPEGKIIAKNLYDKELDDRLAVVLK